MKHFRLSKENIIYLLVLLVLAAAPVAVEWLQTDNDSQYFEWSDIFDVWLKMLPFVLVFILHNYLLVPLLLRHRHRGYYFLCVCMVAVCFFLFQCQQHPPHHRFHHDSFEMLHEEGRHPPRHPRHHENRGSRGTRHIADSKPFTGDGFIPDEEFRPRGGLHHFRGQRELLDTLFLVLMLGMNIGVKLYLRQRDDARKMDELKRSNLEQRLSQLRYQLNPHFLMNTLNNIHALVDIAPESAQDSIVELSRLLRYVLYEADHAYVPLRSELEFMNHYIALMRVRYADTVNISVETPQPVPEIQVPSLLFITFVENAFKHGVSYQSDSFIHIRLSYDGEMKRINFLCTNSLHQHSSATSGNATEGGVGLRNVQQRLDLIYADRYQLDINTTSTDFSVHLNIPSLEIV